MITYNDEVHYELEFFTHSVIMQLCLRWLQGSVVYQCTRELVNEVLFRRRKGTETVGFVLYCNLTFI